MNKLEDFFIDSVGSSLATLGITRGHYHMHQGHIKQVMQKHQSGRWKEGHVQVSIGTKGPGSDQKPKTCMFLLKSCATNVNYH